MKQNEVIHELDIMNNSQVKLQSQQAFINAIKLGRSGTYIVGSVDSVGNLSFSTNPRVHEDAFTARAECNRLAKQFPGKMYLFVRLAGAELLPTLATVSI